MKDELIKLASYLDSLEQRIGNLETVIAANQEAEKEQEAKIADLEQTIQSLTDKIQALEERPIAMPIDKEEEPEVEVELIVDDNEEEEPEIPQEESETVPEEEPEIISDESIVEPEPQINPEQEEEPEPIVKEEGIPETIQTSLFGVTPVEDIRHAISLGDRFLFQRELFGGNGESMQRTLDDLNKMHTLDEAVAYINRLGWNKDSTSYELFMNVLRRRFNV